MEDLIFKAEQGDAEAQFALGERYFYGNRDVSQDDEQAVSPLHRRIEPVQHEVVKQQKRDDG